MHQQQGRVGLKSDPHWWGLLVTPIQETKAYQSIHTEGGKGKAEGKTDSVKRRLTRRFGPLPARAEQRIDAAPVAQLDAWLDGILGDFRKLPYP